MRRIMDRNIHNVCTLSISSPISQLIQITLHTTHVIDKNGIENRMMNGGGEEEAKLQYEK
jgi:ribosomal protein L16/L10AE